MGHHMRLILLPVALLFTSAAFSQPTVETAQYPELERSKTDAQIVAQLQRKLLDPGSITDLRTCAPIRVKAKEGKLNSWQVNFTINAKNAYGGYVGRTYYIAFFKVGKSPTVSKLISASAGGLDGFIVKAIEKDMVDCRRIPDEEVQHMLAN